MVGAAEEVEEYFFIWLIHCQADLERVAVVIGGQRGDGRDDGRGRIELNILLLLSDISSVVSEIEVQSLELISLAELIVNCGI